VGQRDAGADGATERCGRRVCGSETDSEVIDITR
jgi:hypothetical protein